MYALEDKSSSYKVVMRHQAGGHQQNKSTRTATASHKKQTSSRTPQLLTYFVLTSSSLFFVATTQRRHKLNDKKVFVSNLQTLMQVSYLFDIFRFFTISYRTVFSGHPQNLVTRIFRLNLRRHSYLRFLSWVDVKLWV